MPKGLVSGVPCGEMDRSHRRSMAVQYAMGYRGLMGSLRRGTQIVWDGEQGQEGQGGLSRGSNT